MIKFIPSVSLLNKEKKQEELHLSIFLFFSTLYSILNALALYYISEKSNILFEFSTTIIFITLYILNINKILSKNLVMIFFQLGLFYTLLVGYIFSPVLVDGLIFIVVFPIVIVFLNTKLSSIIIWLSLYYISFIIINIFHISPNTISIASLIQLILLHIFITISINFYINMSKLKSKLLILRQSRLFIANKRAKELNLSLKELSMTDELTKLDNRRTILKNLEKRMQLFKRKNISFAVVLVDIDHFKIINDTYGHNKGDEVLKKVSLELNKFIREIDNIGRYGGEEFLILIECYDEDKIVIALKRLIDGIRNSNICTEKNITISAGATIINSQDTKESLIHRADKALYKAKETGRDKFIFSEN